MAMSGGSDNGEPMMEMNTTPLIDVLLVLLIMFIITIPVQTHAVKIDLPVADDSPPPLDFIDPVKNKLGITPTNQLIWNETAVTLNQVRTYLAQTKSMVPEPELQFQPDPLSNYLTVDRALAVIKDSGVTKFGFVGNEQYGSFNKAARLPN
ncbi:biopolymer transporter ExbD [Sphingomonadales bacterium EhC05]|nr:biopolymer transporter ExbD [Sphingomonadales bacterium EhC05]